ncbi:RdRP-domain-containing protein [Atractiella rhizophila]|nr:RdRP-domain-containing protein [Atractiella rhizophila]
MAVPLLKPFVSPESMVPFESLLQSKSESMVRYASTRKRREEFTVQDLPVFGPDQNTLDQLLRLDWITRYHIESLLCKGVIIDQQLSELLDLLPKHTVVQDEKEEEVIHSESALKILRSFQRYDRIFDLKKEFELIGPHLPTQPLFPKAPNVVYIPKLVITPMRVLLHLPEPQSSNFVLRHYAAQAADFRFMRVQFWDEGGRLGTDTSISDDLDANEGVLARFSRASTSGMFIAERTYYYLDSSASQMRTNAFWAICEYGESTQSQPEPSEETNSLRTFSRREFTAGKLLKSGSFTRKEVRNCLGNFDDERVIAKLAARRGQLFSTTSPAGRVGRIVDIPDYTVLATVAQGTVKKYTYSDGVGVTSEAIMRRCVEALGLPPDAVTQTCAAQIRLGGGKGIITAWKEPTPDMAKLYPTWPKPRDNEVWLRPSMKKFKSCHSILGVVKVSGYKNGFLNREVISLLFPRGISSKYLIEMFKQQVDRALRLADDVRDNGKHLSTWQKAITSLRQFPLPELLDAGFAKDPLVRSIIRLLQYRALHNLKWKCWIELESGFNGLGILDELGVLQENQIYCQVCDADGKKRTIVGRCIIWRAPTRHPGDIQIVEAVDHPALAAAELPNVIVFNRKGERDLPNKLGGGDLDGDDYTICWDPNLVPEHPAPPMDYESEKPDTIESMDAREIALEIKGFHQEYLKSDNLGTISNAHLAISDYLGPSDPRALRLATLHSTAVDFAKTGIPAIMAPDLRPERFPDFMGPRYVNVTWSGIVVTPRLMSL